MRTARRHWLAAVEGEPGPAESPGYIRLGDLIPPEASELVMPILNDVLNGRLTMEGAEAALLWILRRFREDIEAKGYDLGFLAKTLIMVGVTGADPAKYRRVMKEVYREAGVDLPPPPEDPEVARRREAMKPILRTAVAALTEGIREVPIGDIRERADIFRNFLAEFGLRILEMPRTPEEGAALVERVARALALLSLLPGGVDFMGMHFEREGA